MLFLIKKNAQFLFLILNLLIQFNVINGKIGVVDQTFCANGRLVDSDMKGFDIMTQQPDGKIIGSGRIPHSEFGAVLYMVAKNMHIAPPDAIIVRYNKDGKSLDRSFGIRNGKITTPVTKPQCIALHSNGTIFIAGRNTNDAGIIAAYNTDGTSCKKFGNQGVILDTTVSGWMSLAIDEKNGTIIVAGQNIKGISALSRYKIADGTLDKTFLKTGKFSNATLGGITSMIVRADGKIILTAQRINSANQNQRPCAMLVQLNIDGMVDNTFGSKGTVTESRANCFTSIALLKDGSILTAGSNLKNQGALFGYMADGKPKSDFGSKGEVADVMVNGGLSFISLLSDGNFITISWGKNGNNTIAAFNAFGSPINFFGKNGHITDTTIKSWHSVFVQPDGNFIVAGSAQNGKASMIRYTGDKN